MDSPTEEGIETGKVLGLVLAFDFLMKNGFIEAATELAFRVEMSDDINVLWDEGNKVTVIEDPLSGEQYSLTDKAFM